MKKLLENLKDYLEMYQKPIVIGLVILLFASIAGFIGTQKFISDDFEAIEDNKSKIRILKKEENNSSDISEEKENSTDPQENILIHVAGAVKEPGVFEMESQSRVIDGVKKAKPTEEADINRLNLAAHLSDGEKIIVPKKGEDSAVEETIKGNSDGRVNLNLADKEELKTLSGIGDKRAQDIIEYRDKKGGFKKKEELQEVSGIGEKTYNSLADDITV